MDLSNQTITLKDGRTLGYAEYGDLKGKPLFFFHGWPSARLAAGKFDTIAKKLHIHIIAPDRPGYGYSDFKKDRAILDWPDDVVELADALKVKKFIVEGVSGGGPYAAVCAYKIPERIVKTGIVVGLAPIFDWPSLDGMAWVTKIGWANFGKHSFIRKVSALMQYVNVLYGPHLAFHRYFFGAKSDRELYIRTPVGKSVEACYKEAFRQGYKGPELDLKLYTNDWGFDVSRIRTKIYLWYGMADQNVSQAMGKYYQSHVRGSKLTMYPNEGHFVSVTHAEEILKILVQ